MPTFYEYQIIHKSGEVKWLHQRNALITDNKGKPVAIEGVVTDITVRKRAEEEHLSHLVFLESLERVDRVIRQSDSLERMLTDVLDAALSIFESDRAWLVYPCDPEAPYWRVSMEKTRQEYPGALAMGRDLPMTPDVRQAFLEVLNSNGPVVYDPQSGRAVQQVSRQFSVQSQILTAVYPKMGKPWVFGMHQCSYARVWSEKDVRLFKEVSRRIADGLSSMLFMTDLHKSEARLRTLVQTIPDLIWLKDPEGVYLACNAMFERFFGAKEADIVGKTDYDFVDRELADFFRDHDRKAVAAGKPSSNEEWITFADDGHRALLNTIKTPMFDAEGRLIGVLGIGRDITESHKLEEQLRHAQKMEAVGTLAGGIAHDFNNILNVIIGFGTMVLDRISDDPLSKEQMNDVLAAAERAANLTKRLLLFSRKEAAEFKPMDVNDLVINMEKMLSRIIGEDIRLATDLMGTKAMVMADAGQMEQVLMNLATNARDAMPEGGSLTIKTELREIDDEFIKAYEYGVPGAYAVISITDTGTGIDKEKQAMIFDPFFTSKEVGKGTGLGLSIAYGIIKEHHGYIKVYSETGKGTTFQIWLPVIEDTAVNKPQADALTSLKGGTETILVAEDDASMRKLTRTVLEAFGYSVITAEDGEEAIIKFMENREKIHLVILDMTMPKKSGKEAFEEIRKTSPRIKTLFMTGYTMDIIKSQKITDAGFDFINKPVLPKELVRKVREILDR
jgi:PAS domain S-box-containing protein